MELDELKNIWKHESFRLKKKEEIADMLSGRSQSIVSKLKRNVWIELALTGVAGLILLYYSLTVSGGALKWAFISFIILFTGYIIYYFKKLNLLNKFDIAEENIKNNIQTLVTDLKAYLSFYKKSYTMLYPFYLLLMLLFVAMEQGLENFIQSLLRPVALFSLGFVCLVFIGCLVWFTNWYLNKLYGNYLRKLEELLRDLQEIELVA